MGIYRDSERLLGTDVVNLRVGVLEHAYLYTYGGEWTS